MKTHFTDGCIKNITALSPINGSKKKKPKPPRIQTLAVGRIAHTFFCVNNCSVKSPAHWFPNLHSPPGNLKATRDVHMLAESLSPWWGLWSNLWSVPPHSGSLQLPAQTSSCCVPGQSLAQGWELCPCFNAPANHAY